MSRIKTTNNKDFSFESLVGSIQETDRFFIGQLQKQVNIALTLRNWFIGFYIFEYERQGKDRATYGQRLCLEIEKRLNELGVKSIRERHLYLCIDLYKTYPEILRTASAKSYISDYQQVGILRTLSAKFGSQQTVSETTPELTEDIKFVDLLLNRLSFSHFIELIQFNTALQRRFYEVQTISNGWSVRNLKRAINSMLYERTGLSTDKKLVLEQHKQKNKLEPEDIFRNPYLLEFLGLEEKPSYSETDLEQAIINHLQNFLLELGNGFCFEARQRRITFDNTHYRIDLVFYHRILKSHVLIDLKIGNFTHADAGQMNVYLNYYKENHMQSDDNPPVGIILCAGKSEALVKYATTGLSEKIFVSKYLTNLPTEKELENIIKEEQEKHKG